MVQTRPGAASSEWLNFIKECSVQYHARKNASISTDKALKAVPKDKEAKEAKQDSQGELCNCATTTRIKSKRGVVKQKT